MQRFPFTQMLAAMLRRAFAWWWGELATFLPERLTGAIGPRHRLPIAEESERGIIVIERRARRSAAAWAAKARGRLVVLRLSPDRALSRRLILPSTASTSLPRLLRLEMDRLMPWPGDQVYLASEVLDRPDGGRKVDVEMTIVPYATVEPVRREFDNLGVRIAAIELAGPGGKRILLPPGEDQAASGRRRLRRTAIAVAAVFGLVVIGLGGLIGWQIWERDRDIGILQSRIAATRSAVEEVQRLRTEIADLSGAQRFIDDKRRATPAASIVVEAASRILPDDVWLTDLSIADTGFRASGYAADASSLIAALEGLAHFADTRFLAPSARDRETGKDQFSVGARIELRLEPQP